jgi:hypothetical protein
MRVYERNIEDEIFAPIAQNTLREILECGPYIDLRIVWPF